MRFEKLHLVYEKPHHWVPEQRPITRWPFDYFCVGGCERGKKKQILRRREEEGEEEGMLLLPRRERMGKNKSADKQAHGSLKRKSDEKSEKAQR